MVVVMWLRRRPRHRAWPATGDALAVPSRISDGTENDRSRVQNMSKWPDWREVRPFQHDSMQARTIAAASPGCRVWPRNSRRSRIPMLWT
jgi:hypothetical protein